MSSKERVPTTFDCANPTCGRRLELSKYRTEIYQPPAAAEEEGRVHRVTTPIYWPFTLFCTCGHYTVAEPG